MQPIMLPPNIIDHFYVGGEHIAQLRGVDMPSPRRPEEWLASTTSRGGEPGVGLSRTQTGELLADLVAADPIGWVGSDLARKGDNGLLVKLLDAGQRLPVHVHPDRAFAAAHLDCPYGKTEAWFVLATSGDRPSVWLGFSQDVDPAELSNRVEAQDSQWLLSRMNRVDVHPGDGILVPAGTVHAIGEGVFVAEVQEPTDFSILLEWSVTTATRDESHLGLGMPLALRATRHQALPADELAALVVHTGLDSTGAHPRRLLNAAADPFFRLDLLAPTAGSAPGLPAGFAVVVVLEGSGIIESTDSAHSADSGDSGDSGDSADSGGIAIRRGQVLAIPAGFGSWSVSGNVRLLACRPGDGWPASVSAPAAGPGLTAAAADRNMVAEIDAAP